MDLVAHLKMGIADVDQYRVMDCQLAFITYMHVLLLVLDAGQGAGQLTYHILQFCVAHLLLAWCARCALWCIAQFDGEHDQFGCHAAAFVVKADRIDTLCRGNESVFAR